MTADEPSEPYQSAIETAEQLRDELEAISESDLPFSYDATQILEALEQAKKEP